MWVSSEACERPKSLRTFARSGSRELVVRWWGGSERQSQSPGGVARGRRGVGGELPGAPGSRGGDPPALTSRRSLEDRIFSRHWEHAGASLEPAHGHATRARLRYARAMVRSLHISSLNTTRCVLCALRPPRHSAAATLAPPLIRHEDVVCGPRRHLAPTRIDSTHNRKHFARICAKEIVISSHATITGLRTRTEKDLRA